MVGTVRHVPALSVLVKPHQRTVARSYIRTVFSSVFVCVCVLEVVRPPSPKFIFFAIFFSFFKGWKFNVRLGGWLPFDLFLFTFLAVLSMDTLSIAETRVGKTKMKLSNCWKICSVFSSYVLPTLSLFLRKEFVLYAVHKQGGKVSKEIWKGRGSQNASWYTIGHWCCDPTVKFRVSSRKACHS